MNNAELILEKEVLAGVNTLQAICHGEAVDSGWRDHQLGPDGKVDPDLVDFPQSIALIHSEVSEALQANRKDAPDDHLPHRKGEEVELADAIHRILDLAEARGHDRAGALFEKILYNRQRADHKKENRDKADGKKY